ncbi:MAG: DUF3794 domain-containing protein [Clostridia bacterium]
MKVADSIVYVGILDKSDFSVVKQACIYKQIILTNCFQIPDTKPDIESTVNIIVEPSITRSKLINTPNEKKIIIHGAIDVKIIYVAQNPEQSVHSAHFTQEFNTFINCHMDDIHCNDFHNFIDIIPYIEDAEVISQSERYFELTTLLLFTVKNCCKKLTSN